MPSSTTGFYGKKSWYKYNGYMTKKMKVILMFAAGVCFLTILATFLIQENKNGREDPMVFTTNIDPANKTINDVATADDQGGNVSFFGEILDRGGEWFAQNFNVWQFYQNLANPYSRYIVLNSGLRKEQVATILSRELDWNLGDKNKFLAMDQTVNKKNMEGYYTPGNYLVPATTKPLDAYETIMDRFDENIRSHYATATDEVINVDLALKIGSIIEREAAGKRDMKLISGIIWNRIFRDMNLEMDSTLQYAKGNNKIGWWPKVLSKDKYINSPYNTYKNAGLPPTPISNVSIAALNAALNPQKTNCIFYLHDRQGDIHCSITYENHLANIKKYYK